MSDDKIKTVSFTACKNLSFDREKFVKSVKMAGIHDMQTLKVTWERIDIDGNLKLVQYCDKRGRLNHPLSCLNESAPYVCGLYEETTHNVPESNIE